MIIDIDNRQDKVKISQETKELIEEAVLESLKEEGRKGNYELSISFVDNDEIKELNKNYRNIDRVTDVLSFPMMDDFQETSSFLGDIVISAEQALEQARDYDHSLEREIIYLTVHSVFHLMGYDHLNDREREKMRRKEKAVMRKISIFKGNKGEQVNEGID